MLKHSVVTRSYALHTHPETPTVSQNPTFQDIIVMTMMLATHPFYFSWVCYADCPVPNVFYESSEFDPNDIVTSGFYNVLVQQASLSATCFQWGISVFTVCTDSYTIKSGCCSKDCAKKINQVSKCARKHHIEPLHSGWCCKSSSTLQ